MISLVLAASLAAAPSPRAASAADTVVHVPRVDALQGLTAFLTEAGQNAALLRPQGWLPELHPYFELDPAEPDALRARGVDPTGALTVSIRPTGRVACTHLTDARLFQEKSAERLVAGSGKALQLKPTTSGGVTSVIAPREAGGQAGYALKGQEACAFSSGGGGFVDDGEGKALLKEASRLVSQSPKVDARLTALPGAAYLLVPKRGLVVGLDGGASELRVEGLSTQLPLPPLQGAGTSPYGAMKPTGLLFSRSRIAPSAMGSVMGGVRALVQRACPECPAAEVSSVARAVAERLTGQVLIAVDSVRSRPDVRTLPGRLFASRTALVAEVTDAAAVKAALAPLARFPGARALADGHALDVKGGSLLLRLKGRQLVLGNDEAVTDSVLTSLSDTGGPLAHAVDFTVDPRRLANGLKQVSLMDVVGDQHLAGLFAAGLEMGPLLQRSASLTGWLDSASGGAHRFSTRWTLAPSR